MALWHFSPKTQRAERCTAEDGGCPYGGEHVEGTLLEARAFEKRIVKEMYDTFTTLSKNTKKIVPANRKNNQYFWSKQNKLRGYENISKCLKQERFNFTQNEIQAVSSYSSEGYTRINGYLRGSTLNKFELMKAIKEVRNLEQAFKKVTPLEEDIVVKRTQKGIFGFEFNDDEVTGTDFDEEDKPKVRIKGYLSTSANIYGGEKGFDFAVGSNDEIVEMNIIIPSGMKVLDINKINKDHTLKFEEEILVEHNTVLIIDRLQYDVNNGRKVVMAHLAPAYKSTDDDRRFYQNVDLDALNEEFNDSNKLKF